MTKRAAILGLATALIVAVAAGSSQAAKTKKLASEVEVGGIFFPPPDYTYSAFGDAHSKKNKCERNRTVTVLTYENLGDEGVVAGTVKTDETGDWLLPYPDDVPNHYTSAEVARKKVTTRSGKKLVCRPDASPLVVTD